VEDCTFGPSPCETFMPKLPREDWRNPGYRSSGGTSKLACGGLETLSESVERILRLAEEPDVPTCRRCDRPASRHVVVELPGEEVAMDLCDAHFEQLIEGARPLGRSHPLFGRIGGDRG
jgi:hypothetical protein